MASRESGGTQKKVGRQNSSNAASNINNSAGAATGLGGDQGNPTSDEYKPIFYDEISDIMRGFGDCERPLRESVILVDKILLQQLRSILADVIDLAIERKNKPEPSQKDFEFLMRKNPVKVYRLQRHLRDMCIIRRKHDEMQNIVKAAYNEEMNGNNSDDDIEIVPEKYDEEKIRRLFRADRISQSLSNKQYKEYFDARRTSFYWRKTSSIQEKLRKWLKAPPNLSVQVYTILSYLAHETIASIVDFAILTRLNSANRQTDPFNRITSQGSAYTSLHLCPEVTQGRGLDGVKPITVKEIREAIRRHSYASSRTLGFNRNMLNRNSITPYLAL